MPLAGKLYDETGDRLTPSHANKNGRRYRYYVSNRLISKGGEPDPTGWLLPAGKLEDAIAKAVSEYVGAPAFAVAALDDPVNAELDFPKSGEINFPTSRFR